MRRNRGFTLLELIISAVILAIGIVCALQLVLWGQFRLKEAENKSLALNLAAWKMEQYQSQSYSKLGTESSPDADDSDIMSVSFLGTGPLLEESGSRDVYRWSSLIKQMVEMGQSGQRVPYKQVEVEVGYLDEDIRGNQLEKRVRLVDFVAYPTMHTAERSFERDDSVTASGPEAYPFNFDHPPAAYFKQIGNGFKVHVDFEAPKDVMIIYNIAIGVTDPGGIGPADTMYTACFVDNEPSPSPVVTRTPIMSQPLINNVVALTESFSLMPVAGGHDIEVKWFKETPAGVITFRGGNIVIIATEKL